MAVQPRYQRFEQVWLALAAAMLQGPPHRVPARHRVVAVDHLAGYAERRPAVDDTPLAMLAARRRRDAPAVVHHNHQYGQFVARPRAPDHAAGEVALGGACVAADDDADALATVALLHDRGP